MTATAVAGKFELAHRARLDLLLDEGLLFVSRWIQWVGESDDTSVAPYSWSGWPSRQQNSPGRLRMTPWSYEARMNRGQSQLGRTRTLETRSEEHTSELQSLMRISYAVFCLKKKNNTQEH